MGLFLEQAQRRGFAVLANPVSLFKGKTETNLEE
jgi:hypothetical protein